MIPGRVAIHCIRPDLIPADERFLTHSEMDRASGFRFESDRRHWIACRSATRRILADLLGIDTADLPLETSSHGKPLLSQPYDGLHFNLSHCADMALLAVCVDGPVGIDIESESRAPYLLECLDSFCHAEEIAELPANEEPRARRLLEIWTAKEAVLKALGTGLSHPPEQVRVMFATAVSDTPLPGLTDQRIHRLIHPALSNHVAMLSAPLIVTGIDILAPLGLD
jgi:4'-phosphopantetheinyl transferase